MLPATVRMRRRREFESVLKRGQRSEHGPVVVHVHLGMVRTAIGFLVSRAVGNAVTRHRVTRQLRHLMATRCSDLPAGTGVVVRALPAAAGRSSADLAPSLDRALVRALDRASSGHRSATTQAVTQVPGQGTDLAEAPVRAGVSRR